jgi:hypothetical protein
MIDDFRNSLREAQETTSLLDESYTGGTEKPALPGLSMRIWISPLG